MTDDAMSQPGRPSRRRLLTLVVAIVLTVAVAITVAVVLATRPASEDGFDRALELVDAVERSQAAVLDGKDAYLTSFTRTLDSGGSIDAAAKAAAPTLDEFSVSETTAEKAIAALRASRVASDPTTGPAIDQFADVASAQLGYVSSLVRSYGDFRALFGDVEAAICSDMFIGETQSLAERRDKLAEATADCYPALSDLRDAGNSTHTEFFAQMDRRIGAMEEHSAATATGEAEYQAFQTQLAPLESRLAELEARGAAAEEYDALRKEVEAVNGDLEESQASFDFAGERYISTVEEVPDLLEAALTTDVSDQLEYFDTMSTIRTTALRTILEVRVSA